MDDAKGTPQRRGEARDYERLSGIVQLLFAGILLLLSINDVRKRIPWAALGITKEDQWWLEQALHVLQKCAITLVVSAGNKDYVHFWPLHLLLSFVGSSGGSHLVAFLAGEPFRILTDGSSAGWFLTSWYLAAFMPVGHVVREWRFVRTPLVAIYNYVSLKASVDRVNKTVETRPGVWFAAVLFGSLSSGGGGSLMMLVKWFFGLHSHPGPLFVPHFQVRRSILLTLSYLTLCHWLPIPRGPRFATHVRDAFVFLLAMHAALVSLGFDGDFTIKAWQAIYFITRIPDPALGAAAWPSKPPSTHAHKVPVPRNGLVCAHTLGHPEADRVWEEFLSRHVERSKGDASGVGDGAGGSRRRSGAAGNTGVGNGQSGTPGVGGGGAQGKDLRRRQDSDDAIRGAIHRMIQDEAMAEAMVGQRLRLTPETKKAK